MALQPLVSYHHGARLLERLTALLKIGLATAFILGLTTALIALLFPSQLMALFGDSSFEIRSMANTGLCTFCHWLCIFRDQHGVRRILSIH